MKTHMGFPPADMLEKSDVTVFFSNNPGWSAANASLLDAYAARGGGLVYLHWAIEGGAAGQLLADRIGLATQRGKQIGYRHGPIQLELHSPRHPILEGFESPLRFEDETYWRLVPGATDISLLAEATEENAVYPQIWTRQYGAGRVLCSIPGHYNWTFDDPLYRLIVLRGICWAGKQETVDRLSELGTVGARLVW
jgi:trehalose utilization protein